MRALSRRTFLRGLAGGAALSLLPWRFSAATEPIIIGHQADLTGVAAVFGFWNDRAARAATERINNELGGIAGRPIRLVTRDTQSSANTGINAFRRLVLEDGTQFVLGTIMAEIAKPTAPLAQQFKAPYFPLDDVPATPNDPPGTNNRYVFRLGHNTRIKAQVSHQWALDRLGKRWTFLSSDGSWGRSQLTYFRPFIEQAGGQILATIFGPIGTQDFLPLFNQVDLAHTEVLYSSFFGSDAVKFFGQAKGLGIFKRVKSFSSLGIIEGLATEPLAKVLAGAAFVGEFPRRMEEIPQALKAFNRELRRRVGVDDEGHQIGGPNTITGEHYFVPWENLYILKRGIEASGWQGPDDTPALIEALEGMSFQASLDFPTGDFFIRPQDHRAFRDYFIEQVQGGKLYVVAHFPKEQGLYPPPIDLTQMGF